MEKLKPLQIWVVILFLTLFLLPLTSFAFADDAYETFDTVLPIPLDIKDPYQYRAQIQQSFPPGTVVTVMYDNTAEPLLLVETSKSSTTTTPVCEPCYYLDPLSGDEYVSNLGQWYKYTQTNRNKTWTPVDSPKIKLAWFNGASPLSLPAIPNSSTKHIIAISAPANASSKSLTPYLLTNRSSKLGGLARKFHNSVAPKPNMLAPSASTPDMPTAQAPSTSQVTPSPEPIQSQGSPIENIGIIGEGSLSENPTASGSHYGNGSTEEQPLPLENNHAVASLAVSNSKTQTQNLQGMDCTVGTKIIFPEIQGSLTIEQSQKVVDGLLHTSSAILYTLGMCGISSMSTIGTTEAGMFSYLPGLDYLKNRSSEIARTIEADLVPRTSESLRGAALLLKQFKTELISFKKSSQDDMPSISIEDRNQLAGRANAMAETVEFLIERLQHNADEINSHLSVTANF